MGGRILIVGGGIGGIAAAIALRRAGFEPVVFERAAKYGEVGAGLTLWANAIRSLDKLGLAESLRRQARRTDEIAFRDELGRVLNRILMDELIDRGGEVSLAVHRADLHSVMREALGPGVVRLGRECAGFWQEPEGVAARFADGSVERGSVLVGADGLRSVVRSQLFGPAPPVYAGYTAWRGVCELDHRRVIGGESWGRGMRFGMLPLSEERLYWFAAANAPEGQDTSDRRRDLLDRFGSWHDPIPNLIRATPTGAILRNDIYDRDPIRRWGQGRVTLLGDAAHPMTPNLGQGACQAIEDAVVLAGCLAAGVELAAGLRAYEARRAPRANRIVLESRRLGRVAQWESPVACAFRNLAVRVMPRSVQVRQLKWVLGEGAG